jgi:hypothetical protein
VWPELREEIELERTAIRQELATMADLCHQVSVRPPDEIEIRALGAMLHSLYNGIEGTFKRVALHLDGGIPSGGDWHTLLLDAMTARNATRPAVISTTLAERLRDYLKFRHVFRHAYFFDLRWPKMAPLVLDCATVLTVFEQEIDAFVRTMDAQTGLAVDR